MLSESTHNPPLRDTSEDSRWLSGNAADRLQAQQK